MNEYRNVYYDEDSDQAIDIMLSATAYTKHHTFYKKIDEIAKAVYRNLNSKFTEKTKWTEQQIGDYAGQEANAFLALMTDIEKIHKDIAVHFVDTYHTTLKPDFEKQLLKEGKLSYSEIDVAVSDKYNALVKDYADLMYNFPDFSTVDVPQELRTRLSIAYNAVQRYHLTYVIVKTNPNYKPIVSEVVSLKTGDIIDTFTNEYSRTNLLKNGVAERLKDKKFYKRQIRKIVNNTDSHLSSILMLVGAGQSRYVTTFTKNRLIERDARNDKILKNTALTLDGEYIPNAENNNEPVTIYDAKLSKDRVRDAILFKVIDAMTEFGRDKGYHCYMITATLPSEYHSFAVNNDNRLIPYNYDYSVKVGAIELQHRYRLVMADLFKHNGFVPFGFWCREPHKDGCIHMHHAVFCTEEQIQLIELYYRLHFPGEHAVDITKAKNAAAYLIKYACKQMSLDESREQILINTIIESDDDDETLDAIKHSDNQLHNMTNFKAWKASNACRTLGFSGLAVGSMTTIANYMKFQRQRKANQAANEEDGIPFPHLPENDFETLIYDLLDNTECLVEKRRELPDDIIYNMQRIEISKDIQKLSYELFSLLNLIIVNRVIDERLGGVRIHKSMKEKRATGYAFETVNTNVGTKQMIEKTEICEDFVEKTYGYTSKKTGQTTYKSRFVKINRKVKSYIPIWNYRHKVDYGTENISFREHLEHAEQQSKNNVVIFKERRQAKYVQNRNNLEHEQKEQQIRNDLGEVEYKLVDMLYRFIEKGQFQHLRDDYFQVTSVHRIAKQQSTISKSIQNQLSLEFNLSRFVTIVSIQDIYDDFVKHEHVSGKKISEFIFDEFTNEHTDIDDYLYEVVKSKSFGFVSVLKKSEQFQDVYKYRISVDIDKNLSVSVVISKPSAENLDKMPAELDELLTELEAGWLNSTENNANSVDNFG